MKEIVFFSMGVCSAYIACRLKEMCMDPICLWSDTKREDEDTYRFGWEVAKRWDLKVVEASDGRDLWDVFRSWKMIPARQNAACSRQMKIEPPQKWLESFEGEGRIAYGYDRDEQDRSERTLKHWRYPNLSVWFPMQEWDISKEQAFGYFLGKGIAVPRMYQHFQHANCLPCKNFRLNDWKALQFHYPEKFAESMALEEETGLKWMQDGPYLRDLPPLEMAPDRKGRKKLAMATPAFNFDMGCDACALD